MKRLLFLILIISAAGGNFVSAFQANSSPEALNVKILGEARTGQTLFGKYSYYDADNDPEEGSLFQWYIFDAGEEDSFSDWVPVTGEESESFILTASHSGAYLGFSVRPVAKTGSNAATLYTAWVGPVLNDPPSAALVFISGSKDVGGTLVGNYTYSDTEGDTEGGSQYRWYSSVNPTGGFELISGATGRTHIIGMNEQGRYFRFRVTPAAISGTSPGTYTESNTYGPANTRPVASNVIIIGSPSLGQVLKGSFNYFDADGDLSGDTIMQWYRGTLPIPGANSINYTPGLDDVDSQLQFEVIPVSSTGYPNTGDAVKSDFTSVVTDPDGSIPLANQICISGTNALNEVLTGKYHYDNKYKESGSVYYWYRDNTIIQSGDAKADLKYTLKPADIGKVIRFAVKPINSRSQAGPTEFSDTLVVFGPGRDTFSSTEGDVLIEAMPDGGIFWGEGITSDGIFSPSKVDYTHSPFTVWYQIDIDNPNTTCLQKVSKELTVTAVTMYFDNFDDVYCQNGKHDTITVRDIPAGATPVGFTITDNDALVGLIGSTSVIIDPGKLTPGNKMDTLWFYTNDGSKISRAFVVDEVVQVAITNLPAGSEFCNNTDTFRLKVTHPGGDFAGPVIDEYFDPSVVTGDTAVWYTYTTARGCVSSTRVPVTINAAPGASFTLEDVCIRNSSDTTRFINTTTSADQISRWIWELFEPGDTILSNNRNPGYLYLKEGMHKVRLSATTVKNCTSAVDTVIDLGVKPAADFYWKNECYHPSDYLFLYDSTLAPSAIISRSWNINNGEVVITTPDAQYLKQSAGLIHVTYIVNTKYNECHDTLSRNIYIRPTFSLAQDDYFEDFEDGSQGWYPGYEEVNSWWLGYPHNNSVGFPASDGDGWYTRIDPDEQKSESSSVVSPCFDFTEVQRPMISLKLNKRFDRERDGAALQYTIKDSDVWKHVGSLDDGINWYNSALISGEPGGIMLGWTSIGGHDTSGVEARHRLEGLEGMKDVKFRISYGNDGTARNNYGIAFDDVWIGPRTRGVLLEHFTNNSSARAEIATDTVTNISGRDTADVINIQYHTNFPGNDQFYNDNPGDVSGRLLFYGVAGVPYSFIDGGTNRDFADVFDYRTPEGILSGSDISRRSLINPLFDIDLDQEVTGGVLTVSGSVKALIEINAGNITLYLAVTEKNSGGNYNTFRKFIPDAGGTALKKTWSKDDVSDIPEHTWIIENIADNADIDVIAFVQNNLTKEVYQAVSNSAAASGAGTKKEVIEEGKKFGIYPNPASEMLTVTFEEETEHGTEIRIFDLSGSIVRSYTPGRGITDYNIRGLGLKSGIYLVKIFENGVDRGHKKLIVTGN
jgi:hypothetical protein